ncbi:hypothetical protein BD410DRAFT_717138 [Rickenella mellea]|uniref:Prokaryotic-type class I peptide chain release factors domain-containing protein n=1 Tax=Rickenella mellea TaxID=50990 RepID=A0A4Y7QFW6_9AGAM|nr:hypothetical protein BD410DRAFT_717138 [Rickenella mellea]
MAAARDWASNFKAARIPRDAVEMSFSRSSGPGGQNVNKVNTKATVRCHLSAKWIPLWAHDRLRLSTSFVASTHSLLITSSVHRSQAQNLEDCLSKLHALVLDASLAAVKNEPSDVQKERVKTLEKIAKSRRIGEKKYKSQIKRSRSKGDWE